MKDINNDIKNFKETMKEIEPFITIRKIETWQGVWMETQEFIRDNQYSTTVGSDQYVQQD